MDIKTIQMMIETRMKAEEDNGNYTEKSFLYALWELSKEYEDLKNKEENNN